MSSLSEVQKEIKKIIEGSKSEDGKLNPIAEAINLLINKIDEMDEKLNKLNEKDKEGD